MHSTPRFTPISTTVYIGPALPPAKRRMKRLRQPVRIARPDRDAACAPALSTGRTHHGGRLALVHHAAAVRRGVLLAFQMQSPPPDRLPPSVGLFARSLSKTGKHNDSEHGAHQDALLPQPSHPQSDRHRTERAGVGFRHAAWARTNVKRRRKRGTWSLVRNDAARALFAGQRLPQ